MTGATEPDFSVVAAHVWDVLGLKHTDIAIADALGIKRSAYSARKKSGSVPYAELIALAMADGLDLNQFFYGPPAGAALPVRVGDPAAAPVAPPPITARHTATASPLPAAHLAMRESALRTLSAALDTLETLHAYEKQGLENGPQS